MASETEQPGWSTTRAIRWHKTDKRVLVKELRMGLDPVAAFMLGMIVGQWLAILMILKVVKAILNRPSGCSVDPPELSEQEALIARLIGSKLPGITKPRGLGEKSVPATTKKSRRRIT